MVTRANKAYIDEHCNMYLDLMSETPELVYHPVMMKCYHDLFISNDYKQDEQDRSFLAFKSWLTTYRWKEVREYFRSKLGYIPDIINNRTYIDDEANIEKSKENIIDNMSIFDDEDFIEDDIHEKLDLVLELLSSLPRNKAKRFEKITSPILEVKSKRL